MSQSLNTDVLTQLHCSVCSGFLSCSPVHLLPNGTFVCGQCSPPSLFANRAQALETLLEKASFPCRFAGHGCTEYFMFGQTVEHELKCEYRSFTCPFTTCTWEGSTSEMFNHFTEAHQEQVLPNANLKVEVNQNSEGVVTVLKENIAFVVKYQYDPESTNFTYGIRFCKSDSILNASYRLQLINNSDPEYTFSLKTVNCAVYDDSFANSQTVQTLNLVKFLDCLDNPMSVLISIHFTIHSKNNSRKRKLDYETNKKYLPLNDETLSGTLNTRLPCRWKNCKLLSSKNKNLKKHQLECQFRQYNCFFMCEDSFGLVSAAYHYKTKHRCPYKEHELSFETSFAKCHDYRYIITIKKHTIVVLEYSVFEKDDCNTINLSLNLSDSKIAGNIHFEHRHCKVKSDSFEITEGTDLKITLDKLPTCFEETDILRGFLTI